MAENGATGSNGPAPVGDQTILDVVAENQTMIRGLLESLPTTIANATAVAQCVKRHDKNLSMANQSLLFV